MGIATLGKSLLSSAKKKAKKGQQLGLFAGAAIGVAGIANSVIRRKAMDRANAFEKSLTPVKKALDKDFLQLGDIEAEYNTRSKLPGGELQSFIDEEFKLLKAQTGTVATGEAKPSDQMYLDLAKKQALSKYEIYKQRVDAYKPMFGVKTEEYYKQYNNLKTLTGVELKNDNLMELLGNKTGWGKDTAQVATEIMLANGKSATLNIPANILEKFDIEYFNKIEERARRAMTIEEIRNKQLITLDEKAKTTNAKALLLSVTPKPSSAVKIDSEVDKAWLNISKRILGTGTNISKNPDFIGDKFIFIDKDDKFKTEFTLTKLLEKLDEINHETGLPFKDTELSGISNRDVLVNKAKEYAQLMKANFMINGSGVIDDIMYEGWMRKGLDKALQGVTIVTDPGFFYGLGPNSTEISLSYAPVDDTPTEVPEPILMLRNRIAEYQDNPMGPPSGVLKDIQRMVEEFPDYKDEFSVYLEDMTRVDGTEKSSTGFKGPITNNIDKSTMTEVSVGVMINGKETLVPAINELTTDAQIKVLQDLKIGVDPIPEDIQITAKKAAEARIEAGLNPFYQDEEEKNNTTTTTSTSLLNPSVPTQEELVKEFEILGASKMSVAEIDIRLNEMINQKEDFTTDEYIKLITYLNSKQGINPASSNTSLLEPTKELTDSEIIANSLKGTGRNPAEVIRDMNTRNSIRNTNLGLKILERETSTARQAVATSGLLRNKDFVEFLESEGTTKEEFNTTTKDYVLNIFNKYLKQLQSK